jgi:UrcA family protein
MNKFNTVVAAAILVASGIATAPAYAGSSNEPQRVVKFQDLDLSTTQGIASLHVRLQAASRAVCAPLTGRGLESLRNYNECYEKAFGDAVKDVNGVAAMNVVARAE